MGLKAREKGVNWGKNLITMDPKNAIKPGKDRLKVQTRICVEQRHVTILIRKEDRIIIFATKPMISGAELYLAARME